MLYNPQWGTKQDFVKWLGEQPPEQSYPYFSGSSCAVAQFYKSRGVEQNSHPELEREMGVYGIVAVTPHTFGAAYKRANGNRWQRIWNRIMAPVSFLRYDISQVLRS